MSYGFGYDPELPAGFQDADLEMAEFEAQAREAEAEERREEPKKGRFELVDSENPRGPKQRFSTRERAYRELGKSFPPGRFFVRDRDERELS